MSELIETIDIGIDVQRALEVLSGHVFADPAICVRELIANAADSVPSQIALRADPRHGLLEVADDGSGMTRAQVESLLGTMFGSSKRHGQGAIGHFGIGFYSCFSLCSEVEVLTRTRDPDDAGTQVRYRGGNRLEIPHGRVEHVGTMVRLTVLPEHRGLLGQERLSQVVRRHCDFLPFPILVGPELVNATDAPWYHGASERDLSRGLVELLGLDEPLAAFAVDDRLSGARVRGVIFFAPRGRPAAVRLYSHRVLVSEADPSPLDEHLRGTVSAVLDVEDLPLTISRDAALEGSGSVRELRPMLVERLASALGDLACQQPTRFRLVMADHGPGLKAACLHHPVLRSRLRDHLPFRSTLRPYVTVPEYVESRGERIVVYADDLGLAAAFLPRYEEANVEVLFMTDPSDASLREGWPDHTFLRLDAYPLEGERVPADVSGLAREMLQELLRLTVGLITVEVRALGPDGPPAVVVLTDGDRERWWNAEVLKTYQEQGRLDDLPRELRSEAARRVLTMPVPQVVVVNASHQMVRQLARLVVRGSGVGRAHRVAVLAGRFLHGQALLASGLPLSPAKARDVSRDMSELATCLLEEAVAGEECDAATVQR